MPVFFASRIPGRIRLRHPALKQKRVLGALIDEISAWEGVTAAMGNCATCGLLVCYDQNRRPQQAMEQALADRLNALPEMAVPVVPPSPARRAWNANGVNRIAKLAGVGGMALSLAALPFSRSLHATAGGIGVAFLLLHMSHHRRKLWK